MIIGTKEAYQKPDLTMAGGSVIFLGAMSLFCSIINFLFRIATIESKSDIGIHWGQDQFMSIEQISLYTLMLVIAGTIVAVTINNMRWLATYYCEKKWPSFALVFALQIVVYGVSATTSYMGINMSFQETVNAAVEDTPEYKLAASLGNSSATNAQVSINTLGQYGNGTDANWKGQSAKIAANVTEDNAHAALALKAMFLAREQNVGTGFSGVVSGIFIFVLLAIVFLLDAGMSVQTFSQTMEEWQLNEGKPCRHTSMVKSVAKGSAVVYSLTDSSHSNLDKSQLGAISDKGSVESDLDFQGLRKAA